MENTSNTSLKKLLTIDDSKAMRNMIRTTFKGFDIDVIEATDGLEAVKIIKQNRPDIILLDQVMPKVDGLTFLKALRKNRFYKDIPVIMLTAERKRSLVEECLETGICYYLIKPFNEEQLIEKVDKIVSIQKKRAKQNNGPKKQIIPKLAEGINIRPELETKQSDKPKL